MVGSMPRKARMCLTLLEQLGEAQQLGGFNIKDLFIILLEVGSQRQGASWLDFSCGHLLSLSARPPPSHSSVHGLPFCPFLSL